MRPAALCLALATVVMLAACSKQEAATKAAAEAPPVTAAVVTVATEILPITIPVTGTLVSNTRVEIKAEVIGHISRFDKQEGDPVRAGEPVVWVDDENFRLASARRKRPCKSPRPVWSARVCWHRTANQSWTAPRIC